MDYQNDAYNSLKHSINELFSRFQAPEAEWEKARILANTLPYLDFVAHLSKTTRDKVSEILKEIADDKPLHALLRSSLERIAALCAAGLNPGEIRVHAFTVYSIIRLTRPELVLETGVSSGKSSAMILRAIDRNGRGRLVSVDIGDFSGATNGGMLDRPENATVGWFVPEQLRKSWELIIGDAREILPEVLPRLAPLDIFIHDSLHTYEHMSFEYKIVQKYIKPGGLLLSDDIQHTKAFADAAAVFPGPAYAFGTFGGLILPNGKK